jgi:hypothetical protein
MILIGKWKLLCISMTFDQWIQLTEFSEIDVSAVHKNYPSDINNALIYVEILISNTVMVEN